VQECARFSRDSGNDPRLLPADPNIAGQIWLGWIRDHYVSIAEDGAKPVGYVLAWRGRHPFNPEVRTLTCGMWRVAKGYERTRAGVLLLDAFTAFGQKHADVTYFTLQKPTGDRALARRGFRQMERDFERWTIREEGS
jgi:hypothetical protein